MDERITEFAEQEFKEGKTEYEYSALMRFENIEFVVICKNYDNYNN